MTHYASREGDDNMIGPWALGGGEEGVPQAGVELDVTNVGPYLPVFARRPRLP